MKEQITKTIIELTKACKIKSFTYNGEVRDFINCTKNMIEPYDIKVSNKYIPLLAKQYELEDLKPFTTQNNNFHVIKGDKFITFEVSHHSALQFLKRFVYIYLYTQTKFALSAGMEKLFANNIDEAITMLIDETFHDIGSNQFIHYLIAEFIKGSKNFDVENVGRRRDTLAFNHRNEQYDKTTRYFNHPFLFVIDNNTLKTVELYSASLDCRDLNKFTCGKQFKYWLINKIGVNK